MSSPVAATISAAGITAPSYATVLSYLQSQYQAIFGADSYLGNDSQDGQLLAIFAASINDCNNACIAAYNARSPVTAQGTGLDAAVKINGLTRSSAVASTAVVTVTGVAGTVITNGVAGDTNGVAWALPTPLTIPAGGTLSALATCTVLGAVAAAAHAISIINTPVYGWQTVDNASPATAGAALETDAGLRNRQAISTTLPSLSIFAGILSVIEAVAGVTRVAPGYENNTNGTTSTGIPARNLAFVVEGGNALDIATAINGKIPPGIPTYATAANGATAISQVITDGKGSSRTINFMAPGHTAITVAITVHGLTNWNTAAEPYIQAAVQAYVNAQPIGSNLSYTGMIAAAYNVPAPFTGTYNVTAFTVNGSSSDVTIAWNAAPQMLLANSVVISVT